MRGFKKAAENLLISQAAVNLDCKPLSLLPV